LAMVVLGNANAGRRQGHRPAGSDDATD